MLTLGLHFERGRENAQAFSNAPAGRAFWTETARPEWRGQDLIAAGF